MGSHSKSSSRSRGECYDYVVGLPHGGWGSARHKRTNDVCGHVDKRHYAKGLCWPCYRRRPDQVAMRKAYYLSHKAQFVEHDRRTRAKGTTAKRLYGLLPVTYRRMKEAQQGLCYLCQRPPGRKSLGVDHNHKTGKIRALLCARCNMALGGLRDDPALCRRAADYLELWS